MDPSDWDLVREALENRKVDSRLTLSLLGQTVLQMKTVEGAAVEVRKFAGPEATSKLTREITKYFRINLTFRSADKPGADSF